MKTMLRAVLGVVCSFTFLFETSAQDSVDVTFRWKTSGQSGYSVPGEFNGWNQTAWPLINEGDDLWTRTGRLQVGGGGLHRAGVYEYKFYYTGAIPWVTDPLNHHVDISENNNSYLYIKDPTIYHFIPNERTGTVITRIPTISAYLYPKVGSVVDTSLLSLTVDGATYTGIGEFYNFSTQQFSYPVTTPLSDGSHTAIIAVGTSADTVSFTVNAPYPVVTIRQIQQVPADSLLAADAIQLTDPTRWTLQASPLRAHSPVVEGDTLVVTALCVVPAKVMTHTQSGYTLLLYGTSAASPWRGIVARVPNPDDTTQAIDDGILNVRRGHIIQITGWISEFPLSSMNSVTQLNIVAGTPITIIDSAVIPAPAHVNVSDFYQGSFPGGSIRFSTGEPYEGMIVEMNDLTLTSKLNTARGTFTMQDAGGNEVTMYDMSKFFTLGHGGAVIGPPDSVWALTYPLIGPGTRIRSIRGLINTMSGPENTRGYVIAPMYRGDILFGPPVITSFLPPSGTVGSSVTITGTNFGLAPSDNIVYFGAVRATVTSATATMLDVTVPAGATYAPITVTTTTAGLTAYSQAPFVVTFNSSYSIDTRAFAGKVDLANGSSPYMVVVGDLDGDGKPDLVAGSNDSSSFTLLRNTSAAGSITFAPAVSLPAGFGSITVFPYLGDIDGDGKLDLVCPVRNAQRVAVLRNTSTVGNFSFASPIEFVVGNNPRRAAIHDYDGDGKPDLAVANLTDNSISVLRNSSVPGSISFESKIDFATEDAYRNSIFAGDIEGDGKPDLIVLNFNGASFSVLKNASSTGSISFAPRVSFDIGASPFLATGLGDLDGDGKLDVAVVGQNTNSAFVFRNTSSAGTISFATSFHVGTGPTPYCIGIGDIDGDGKPDLAVNNNGGNAVSLFKNESSSGTISFRDKVDFVTGVLPISLAVNDLDGDAQPDLVVANINDRTLSVLRNTLTPQAVTFQVNMKVKMLECAFLPESGDVVTVSGTFNDWNAGIDTLQDMDGDSVYAVTISNLSTGPISYKFRKTLRGGTAMEGDPNREYTVAAGSQTLPVVYFDRDSVVNSNIASVYLKNRSQVRVLDSDPVRPDANPSAYDITESAITLEAWIFPIGLPPFPGSDIILSRPAPSGGYGGYDLAIRDTSHTGEPRISFRVSLGDTHLIVRDVSLAQLGVWQHVAGTYDGATARLYINGNLVSSASLSRSIAAGEQGFFIGGRTNSTPFHGLIDEARLWNVVRTQPEIQLYQDSTLHGDEAGLAGYWPLEGVATVNGKYPVTIDRTANHNDLWAIQDAEFVSLPVGSVVTLPPELVWNQQTEAIVGAVFSARPSTGGWPVPGVSFVYGPIGMTFDPPTGSVNWIPSTTQTGFNSMRFRADNSSGSAENTFTMWVNALPTVWRTHNNNNVTLDLANNGMIGKDALSGFLFNEKNGLYEATVIVGRSSSQVSGSLYKREFAVQDTFRSITSYLNGFDQAFETRFNDQRVTNQMGIQIIQRSHSKSTNPDRNFVVLDYEIINTSGSDLSGIYVGLAADDDIGNFNSDLCGYDVARSLLYMYESGGATNSNYYGMVSLTGSISGYAVWINGAEPDQADSALYARLTSTHTIPAGPPADYRQIIGTGGYNIPAGGSVRVMFALVAGANLGELQVAADAARAVQFRANPTILSVRDVPNDQGGHLTLRWNASSLDNLIHNLPYYSIWRSLPEGALLATKQTRHISAASDSKRIEVVDARMPSGEMIAVSPKYRLQTIDGANYAWEWIADQPAHRFATYSFTAPTLYDSMATTNGRHYFLVSAQTSDPYVYYDSNVDSSYSVDNLSPGTPLNAGLTPLAANRVQLNWDRNGTDPDVLCYRVYRDTTCDFLCADSTRFLDVSDTTVIDSTLQSRLSYYYRIVSVDIHGNESLPTAQLINPSSLTTRASIKMLLEGPYNGGTLSMNKTLRTGGYLAAHFGSIPIPFEAVDSISIEIRSAASGATTRKFLPAWLLADGTIRNFSDTIKSYVEFDTLAGDYYLVVYHRNHIPIMTATVQALNGATPSPYDFTTAQSQGYSTSPGVLDPMIGLGAGGSAPFGMIAGDADGSGVVDASDRSATWNLRNQSGYRAEDVDLSGVVDASDRSITWNGRNRSSLVP